MSRLLYPLILILIIACSKSKLKAARQDLDDKLQDAIWISEYDSVSARAFKYYKANTSSNWNTSKFFSFGWKEYGAWHFIYGQISGELSIDKHLNLTNDRIVQQSDKNLTSDYTNPIIISVYQAKAFITETVKEVPEDYTYYSKDNEDGRRVFAIQHPPVVYNKSTHFKFFTLTINASGNNITGIHASQISNFVSNADTICEMRCDSLSVAALYIAKKSPANYKRISIITPDLKYILNRDINQWSIENSTR